MLGRLWRTPLALGILPLELGTPPLGLARWVQSHSYPKGTLKIEKWLVCPSLGPGMPAQGLALPTPTSTPPQKVQRFPPELSFFPKIPIKCQSFRAHGLILVYR